MTQDDGSKTLILTLHKVVLLGVTKKIYFLALICFFWISFVGQWSV